MVDATHFLQGLAQRSRTVSRVNHNRDARNPCRIAYKVGTGEQLVSCRRAFFREPDSFCPEHQVRKINIPLMRRHIRALGHVAQITEIALVHNFPVILFSNAIDLHGVGFVNQIEQRRKTVTKRDTTPAPMAQIKDPLHLRHQLAFIIEVGALPIDRMANRRPQAAFSHFSHNFLSSTKTGGDFAPPVYGLEGPTQSSKPSSAFWNRLA